MLNVGQERNLSDLGFYVLDSIKRLYTNYTTIGVVRQQWADDHPDLLVRYLRAHMRAVLWIEDPANAAEAAQYQARATLVKGTPIPPPFAWDGIREMMAIRRDAGLLRGDVEPRRMADDRYYQQVIGDLASRP
jgi:hypothetical protein